MIGRTLDFAFPYPQNVISARFHISILRTIKCNAPTLPMVKRDELRRISMPVVAVKLNDRITRRHKSVNTKLVADKILRIVGYTDFVKHGISGALKVVWMHFELFGIHATQKQSTLRISITTGKRTIFDIVGLSTRWRPAKRYAANNTGIGVLVTALPFIGMCEIAKVVFCRINAIGREVKNLAAQFAWNLLPILTLRAFCFAEACKGAIRLVGPQSLGNGCSAAFACNCTNGVFIHAPIVTDNGGTIKPMGIMRYA
jgi:hypothetical protein